MNESDRILEELVLRDPEEFKIKDILRFIGLYRDNPDAEVFLKLLLEYALESLPEHSVADLLSLAEKSPQLEEVRKIDEIQEERILDFSKHLKNW